MFDGKALGEQLTVVVRDYVSRATAGFSARLDELAQQIKAIPAGPQGQKGESGKDGDPGAPAVVDYDRIATEIADAVKQIPVPRDGRDGTSVSIEDVSILVRAAVAAIPPAVNGSDGAPGKDAVVDYGLIDSKIDVAVKALPPAAPGRDAVVDYERIESRIEALVKALPVPKDGAEGPKGDQGERGLAAPPVDIDEVVKTVLDRVPRPADGVNGKDCDMEQVKGWLTEQSELAAEMFAQRLIKRLEAL